jgi:hypothetical protein
MEPIRTARANMVYRGPSPDIGDAWAEATADTAYLVWEPTPDERAAIAAGANLRLGVHQHPMPPVSLGVTEDRALSPAGEAWLDRAMESMRAHSPSPFRIPPGCWVVSPDVWERLQQDGALSRGTGGIPTLFGRVLMEVPSEPWNTLRYEPIGSEPAKVGGRYA